MKLGLTPVRGGRCSFQISFPKSKVLHGKQMSSCSRHCRLLENGEDGLHRADFSCYASLVRQCTSSKCISSGQVVHDLIVKAGLEGDTYVKNLIMNMYGHFNGFLFTAYSLFMKIYNPDIFSWNFIIRAYQHAGRHIEAYELFHRMLGQGTVFPDQHICMREEGLLPNRDIILTVLDACGMLAALQEGRYLHASFAKDDLILDSTIQASLSNIYFQCADVNEKQLSPFSYTECTVPKLAKQVNHDNLSIVDCLEHEAIGQDLQSIFKESAQKGMISDSLHILKQMRWKGILPDKYSLATLISACSSQSAISEGEQVYAFINEAYTLGLDPHLGTALISFFGKCGKLEVAKALFDRIPTQDVVSWTAMIDAYLRNGESRDALRLYKQMKLVGIKPNEMTFAGVLDACVLESSLAEGKQVHQEIVNTRFECNLFVGTTLLSMYGRFSCLEDANLVFDKMPCRDVVAWNAMVAASAQNDSMQSFQQWLQMQEEGVLPNKATIISILNACTVQNCLTEGKRTHSQIVAVECESDLHVATALIHMYGRCEYLSIARSIFDTIPDKDTFLCTAMVAAYAHNRNIQEAFNLFDKMLSEGLSPDKISFMSILSACVSKTGLDDGRLMHMRSIFCGLDQDGCVAAGLINMYGKCGVLEDAVKTLKTAPKRDMNMYIHILSACAIYSDLVKGRRMHTCIVEVGLDLEVPVGNALINMYSKCGILQEAKLIFEKMSELDIGSWTVMITSHAQHGEGEYALKLFDLMQIKGVHPNKVTLTNILNAFTHAGMIDEGFRCFGHALHPHSTMQPIVDHYNIIVDLLGRAGRLSEAEYLISKMPLGATACTWTSLLDACRNHLDVERAEQVVEHVFGMRPNDRAPYITMYSLYSAAN
ncbi:hypothetical protein KP509_12G028500 [Ceratopteris richardii]|uniref:Pentatricopeptide repeat-containing protein n=2 Tax=Ceratopteris richardii TaxID=49495 RepID=A0A8T2THP3_CERRI|nr:hypothetical protein KP509_12G028500 [Ceratopteris richardii]